MGYFHVVYMYGLLPHQPRKLGLLRPTLLSRYCHVQTIQSILPKPELRNSWGDSLAKQPLEVTLAEVSIICAGSRTMKNMNLFTIQEAVWPSIARRYHHRRNEAVCSLPQNPWSTQKKHPTVPMLTEWGVFNKWIGSPQTCQACRKTWNSNTKHESTTR